FGLIVFCLKQTILFGMKEYLLAAFLIFETKFVEIVRTALRRTSALYATLCFVRRQRIGRHHIGIVNRTNDNWPVGIAFEKIDDNLLPDTGDVNHAPLLTGPRSSDANPTRTLRIVLSSPIPMELNFNSRVLVREDVFAIWSANNGCL